MTQISNGNPNDDQQLLIDRVYERLRQLAHGRMSGESSHTLQATALVHESWLRLGSDLEAGRFNDEKHFIAVAAETMRRVLIDHARSKHSLKRGGGWRRITESQIDAATSSAPNQEEDLLRIHNALDQLAADHPRKAEIVNLRYFAGLSIPEVAAVIGISVPTVNRDWQFARAWLRHTMDA
ncbi:MAG: RNA polymerase sigma factor (TIGR02999 family) [Verrucomicrobiales bacterium]|jgi:RNA polymerase sigma factor (TIGR02999 family)